MLFLRFLPLLVAAIAAEPILRLEPREAAVSCPHRNRVYSALRSYSSASSFCSAQLGIKVKTLLASSTSSVVVTSTTTVHAGTYTSLAPAHTITSTAIATTVAITTSTLSKSGSTATVTVVTTITGTGGGVISPASCAVSHAANLKRAVAVSTPTQLTRFNDRKLSDACSCLDVETKTVGSVKVFGATVTSKRTVTVPSTTVTSTPTTHVVSTSRVTVHSTVVVTHTYAATTITVHSTSTIASGTALSTPGTFYLKSSTGHYVTLASVSNGLFYLTQTTSTNAMVFKFVGTQLWSILGGQYYHYIAVGTPANTPASADWFPMEMTKDGTDDGQGVQRGPLCCGLGKNMQLMCGGGELFGRCYEGLVYEGPVAAATQDYYYGQLGCENVTLTAVANK